VGCIEMSFIRWVLTWSVFEYVKMDCIR
jgi:hypothetical protein